MLCGAYLIEAAKALPKVKLSRSTTKSSKAIPLRMISSPFLMLVVG